MENKKIEMSDFVKKTYKPRYERKNILLLSDDLRMSSGIGTMSKEFIMGTCQYFNWYQLAAAIKHPDEGKIFDLSDEFSKLTGVPDPKVILRPNSGYGDAEKIRQIIHDEKIDAILHYTDPRFFIWLYQLEHEIRQNIPIIYYNIWDNYPYPMYNKPYYESCDGLFSISKQTLNINKNVLNKDDWYEINNKGEKIIDLI